MTTHFTAARPWLIGTARGILEALVLLACFLAIQALGAADVPDSLTAWAPIIIAAVRSLEGFADDRIDPTVRRGPLRGDPLDPLPK